MQLTRISSCLFLTCALAASGCSSDNDNVIAPASITNTSYLMQIESGSGLFADTGSYVIRIAASDTYDNLGQTDNLGDSTGTYVYTSNAQQGLITFSDSTLGNGTLALNFETSTTGSFLMTLTSDTDSRQSGTFEEQ